MWAWESFFFFPELKKIQEMMIPGAHSGNESAFHEGGMFREDSIETCILSRVKQITSPGWMHETSAQGWCTGRTQRDGMGREVGGGIGMGSTCKSMADSCQCMEKTTTIL